jgi:predicted transcriptional regulator
MKKKLFALLLVSLLLTGCTVPGQPAQQRYTATFLDVFDTVTTVIGFAESEEAFTQSTQKIHDELLRYHQLFDIYNSYEGIVNLKDAVYPNWMVRKIANAHNTNSDTTILYDTNNYISEAWFLGNCNNKFVTILINKSGELIYFYKGAMPKSEQRRFIAIAQRLM